MLDHYLSKYPLYPLQIIVLAAGIVWGTLGWMHVSMQARAAWDHAALVPPDIAGPGAYRAALRRTLTLRIPLSVRALGFISYALYAGHACAALVFVDAAFKASLVAPVAAALAGLGIVMSRYAKALVLRNPTDVELVRRRGVSCAILFLLVHCVIVLALFALNMRWMDTLSVNVYYSGVVGKWEGQWKTMNLREFIEKDWWLFGPRMGGFLVVSWRALGRGLLAYACGALVEAVLVLTVAKTGTRR